MGEAMTQERPQQTEPKHQTPENTAPPAPNDVEALVDDLESACVDRECSDDLLAASSLVADKRAALLAAFARLKEENEHTKNIVVGMFWASNGADDKTVAELQALGLDARSRIAALERENERLRKDGLEAVRKAEIEYRELLARYQWVPVSELPKESCYCAVSYGPNRLRWSLAWCSVIEGEDAEFQNESRDDITPHVHAWFTIPWPLPAEKERG